MHDVPAEWRPCHGGEGAPLACDRPSLAVAGDERAPPPRPVSTHVLVSAQQLTRLRELSRTTRVAQSEYLREAVDDLLAKYGRRDEGPRSPGAPTQASAASAVPLQRLDTLRAAS